MLDATIAQLRECKLKEREGSDVFKGPTLVSEHKTPPGSKSGIDESREAIEAIETALKVVEDDVDLSEEFKMVRAASQIGYPDQELITKFLDKCKKSPPKNEKEKTACHILENEETKAKIRAREAEPTAKLGEPTAALGEPTAKLGEPTAALGEPTAKLGEPTAKLDELTAKLDEPTAAPSPSPPSPQSTLHLSDVKPLGELPEKQRQKAQSAHDIPMPRAESTASKRLFGTKKETGPRQHQSLMGTRVINRELRTQEQARGSKTSQLSDVHPLVGLPEKKSQTTQSTNATPKPRELKGTTQGILSGFLGQTSKTGLPVEATKTGVPVDQPGTVVGGSRRTTRALIQRSVSRKGRKRPSRKPLPFATRGILTRGGRFSAKNRRN